MARRKEEGENQTNVDGVEDQPNQYVGLYGWEKDSPLFIQQPATAQHLADAMLLLPNESLLSKRV